MIGFIVWVLVNGWLRRMRLKLTADFQSKLLDRIGSLSDLNDFVQTEGGKKLLDGLAFQLPSTRPHESILRTIQVGIVLLSLGAAFVLLRLYFGTKYSAYGDYEVLTIVGAIGLSLGVGFLISAAASYGLSRRLGVFDQNRQSRPADVRLG